MENLAKTLIDASKERLRNKFLGTYFFAFLAWNWKKFAVLFWSNRSIEIRILDFIDNDWYLMSIWLPFIVSIFLYFAIPYLNLFLEKYSAKIKKDRKDIQLDIIKSELTKQKVNAVIEGEINELKSNFKKNEDLMTLNTTLNDEIREQNEKIKKLKEDNSALNIVSEKLNDTISEELKLKESQNKKIESLRNETKIFKTYKFIKAKKSSDLIFKELRQVAIYNDYTPSEVVASLISELNLYPEDKQLTQYNLNEIGIKVIKLYSEIDDSKFNLP